MPIYGSPILSEVSQQYTTRLSRQLPKIPLDKDGPVFDEPWQAQIFAITVMLHRKGIFTWSQWTKTLGQELQQAGPDDRAENYYYHWMGALEKLVESEKIIFPKERETRKSAWDKAARATPHGNPILLENSNQRALP